MSAGRVNSYTRRTSTGKRVKVKQHIRRQLQPGRAGRHAVKGYRSLRRRQYGKAAACVGVAAAEFGAWAAFRGAGVALMTVAVVAALGARAARRAAR